MALLGRVESRKQRAEKKIKMKKEIDYTNPYELASLGWNVFPCHSVNDDGSCTCGDSHGDNANSIGKHPRITDWSRESTTKHSKIQEWADTYGHVNWAVVCRISRMVVFDVDPRNGGTDGLAELKKALGGSWVSTFTVATGLYETADGPERGLHYYFQAPPNSKFPANLGKAFPGIDIKYNGYVMAPGSTHKSGVKYEVVEAVDAAPIPEELASRIPKTVAKTAKPSPSPFALAQSASPYGATALEDECVKVSSAPEGNRNSQLFKSGISIGQLVAGGELPPESVEKLIDAAKQAGLGDSEIEQTLMRADGALDRGIAEPRISRSKAYEVGHREPYEADEDELAELIARAGRVDWVEAFNTVWEQEWFVPGFIAAQRGHSLYSDAGMGKSAIVRQACAELATQRVVLGTQAFSRPLVVLYFDHENSILGDVVPHLKPLGYEPEELENLVFLSFPNIAELDTKQGGLEFERLLDHFNPEFVVLDTVSRTISQDENLNKTWLDFYKFAGAKLKSREIAYIRLDHSGKVESRGQRGGSAKKGDLDLVWHLSSSEEDKFLLHCEKNRLPLDSKAIGVHRRHEPFLHVFVDVTNSLDFKSLYMKHQRNEEIQRFVQDQIDKAGGVIGYTGIWNKYRDHFKNLKWRRSEIQHAFNEITRREMGIGHDSGLEIDTHNEAVESFG